RIDWNPTSVVYWVDGALIVSHPIAVAGPMRPLAASDYNVFGGNVVVDWMRMDPFLASGTFLSRIFNAETPVDWHSISWTGDAVGLAISVRMGNTPTPDASWTDFVPVAAPGPISGRSQYIQYRADLWTSDPKSSPDLHDIVISTNAAPVAANDAASTAMNTSFTFPPSGPGSLLFNDTDPDPNTVLHISRVTAPAHGTAV